MSNNKSLEFPDIIQFLDISRTFIRQIEILQDSNLTPEQKGLTAGAVKKLINIAHNYLEVDVHDRSMQKFM